MLFSGVIYAWSILKVPMAENFGWTPAQLALNFTLTMCFYCVGLITNGLLEKRIGSKPTIIIGAVLAFIGFMLTSRISGEKLWHLYFFYSALGGTGIGMAYGCIISAVGAWFPDRKGTCTGVLMMAFGLSTLILGNVAPRLFAVPGIGWRGTYVVYGIALGIALLIAGLIIRRPGKDTVLPPVKVAAVDSNKFATVECTPGQMVRRPSFWLMFIGIPLIAAVGSTTISFANDLSVSLGASVELAALLVGMLSVFNGLGRIISGKVFDMLGCKKGLVLATIVGIIATVVVIISVLTDALVLCAIGICLAGLSYGACPTAGATITAIFYGQKHFSQNFAILNINLCTGSFIATGANALMARSGGFIVPFAVLTLSAVIALALIGSIKKP